MNRFQFIKPDTIDEAIQAFREGNDPIFMAGGMTLIASMKQRLAAPEEIIDLAGLKMSGIERQADGIEIGALTTHAEIEASNLIRSDIPALSELAGLIGDPQVRNRGTIGGAIANADPAADYPAGLLGLNAEIRTNKRVIKADDFFLDLFDTALEEGELITSIFVKTPDKSAYKKLSNPASRYAIVGVYVSKYGSNIRVGVTGAGPNAYRW